MFFFIHQVFLKEYTFQFKRQRYAVIAILISTSLHIPISYLLAVTLDLQYIGAAIGFSISHFMNYSILHVQVSWDPDLRGVLSP